MSPVAGDAPVEIREADLDDAGDGSALVELIDSYARGPGGRSEPLTDQARERLVPGLKAHPGAFVLLACRGPRPVGVVVCVWSYSTFAGQPFLNIHDFAVLPEERGRGIGTALLHAVEDRARQRGCCKITLEVHDSNEGAKRLYERHGFGPWKTPTLYATKPLI